MVNRLILVATAKLKGFQSSHAGKEVRYALAPLDGRYTTKKKNQVENKTTQGSFLREPSETKHFLELFRNLLG